MVLRSIVFQSFYLFGALYQRAAGKCSGSLVINAMAPEILDMSQKPYHEQVGQISYSVDSAGNLNLTSITTTFTCGSITNFVSSNITAPASAAGGQSTTHPSNPVRGHQSPIQSVGAQIHCSGQQEAVGVDVLTPWKTVVFYGSLFFQIDMEGDKCGKPAELVLDYSRCSYNVTTDTGRNEARIPCNWFT